MWLKWLPWRFAIRTLARSHGFLDPVALLARLERFAQPSEVAEPVELLRAGVVFHARGLINSRAIQHNLDWVWPFWVERQFDPRDKAFVPRAFSITHVNLTHRNWTAVGVPDCSELPIVDPRGLLTPWYDGWSVDAWLVTEDGRSLLPSRSPDVAQRLDLASPLAVETRARQGDLALIARADVCPEHGHPICRLEVDARSSSAGWVVISLRPYNPEGVSLVHRVALSADRLHWIVDGQHAVHFSDRVERHHVSGYREGDVFIHLFDLDDQQQGQCNVGMTTAAALFALRADEPRKITARIRLQPERAPSLTGMDWSESLRGHCRLETPDERFQRLYDTALRTLILHSPDDVFPGPYTYKRFWFRDAAFIIHALLCAGFRARAERALERFPARQRANGYFHSQDGEWDSNGEALWIMRRFCELSGCAPPRTWRSSVIRGARWIARKRLTGAAGSLHEGLLPAGFSAEHLGPNDFYYWDDFWGIAGLRAGAWLAERLDEPAAARDFAHDADAFAAAVDRSLERVAARLGRAAIPASPYRRLDAGAIGSLAVGHPLALCAPEDARLLDTVRFLLARCFVAGGFFQDMIHSGINPYLTLHVAEVLLRAGDPRCLELMDTVACAASPTGQWPEAIHPHTGGGCMGDGQHVWAAAEWVQMQRNCLLREEGESLVLLGGLPARWLRAGAPITFGPAPTTFGVVRLRVDPGSDADRGSPRVSWRGEWWGEPPAIRIRAPGHAPVDAAPGEDTVALRPAASS